VTIPRFIVVSGLIGVGKSTFTKKLAELLGYRAIFEPVESNPYLEKFYKEPKKWAYPMQEFLKSRRFAAYQFAFWGLRHDEFPGVILDRSIQEDTVFSEINANMGNIHPLDWQTYLRGFQDMQAFLPEPDVYIFLDAPPEVCHARIAKRAREAECGGAGVPLDYLKTLHDGYMRWLALIAPRVQVAKIDWTDFGTPTQVWEQVLGMLQERSRFTRSLVGP